MVAQPGEPSLTDCALSSAMRDNVVLDPRDALASSLLLALAWLLSTNTSVAESRDPRTYRSFEACMPFWIHHTEKEHVASSLGYLFSRE
ncbi:uncharacterized protein ARMOST_14347 [Armillaria ostoyae]|uniref:Uncharacterized protein n=1 Tax=Armillaria ostoyae TaxID=47428 RepID=A0A284RQC7_ARMOS|nr:uncharacterized protein ARMOST_14347 [Armillaria ostoyae]